MLSIQRTRVEHWNSGTVIVWLSIVVGWAALSVVDAHLPDGASALASTPLLVWQVPPLIVVPMALAIVWYLRGQRRDKIASPAGPALFAGALLSIVLVLLSPIEGFSDEFLTVHQIEHMTLQMTAPMLLILAAPQAPLLRGMPGWLRHRLVPAIMGHGVLHRAFAIISQPVMASLLLVSVHDFWMIPRFHDVSLTNPAIHEVWHFTLFASGLIFFFRLLDRRLAPLGASLPARLLMCWIAEMNAILFGFYLSFKSGVLYDAYDRMAPLWHISALADERIAGIVMWNQGTMMVALGGLMACYRIARRENRGTERLVETARPLLAADLRAERERANRAMAFGLFGFIGSLLLLTFIAAIAYNYAIGHKGTVDISAASPIEVTSSPGAQVSGQRLGATGRRSIVTYPEAAGQEPGAADIPAASK